jgi:hypothetical protein
MSKGRNPLEATGLGVEGRSLAETGGNTPERIRTSNLRFRRRVGCVAEIAWKPLGRLDLNPIGSFCKGRYLHAETSEKS